MYKFCVKSEESAIVAMTSISEPSRITMVEIAILLLLMLSGFLDLSISPADAAAEAKQFVVATHETYFVALNGSDAAPGTANRPWATINHAAETVIAGDMVVVRGGRYALTAQVRPRNSGRSSAW